MANYLAPGVSVDEVSLTPKPVTAASTSIAAFVGRSLKGPVNQATRIHGWLDFERAFGGLDATSTLSFAVRDFFRNGGTHAVIVRLDSDDYLGSTAKHTGLYALDDIEVFNLLCIPPCFVGADTADTVWQAATRYCEDRRAMLIIDPPSHWTSVALAVAGMTAGMASTSPNAALYFPRIQLCNPLADNLIETFVPCGAIAGIISRTDVQRGVWKAPAGRSAVLRGIEGLSLTLTNGDTNLLNTLGANCLRTLPGIGEAIWGARTLQGAGTAGEWRYLSVRRTALHIQQSLEHSLRWTAFEPNSEALWKTIQLSISPFFNSLFRDGAFQGQSSTQAYFIRCDQTTTSTTDISQGRVNLIVGLAFSKPAEFSILQIRLQAQASP